MDFALVWAIGKKKTASILRGKKRDRESEMNQKELIGQMANKPFLPGFEKAKGKKNLLISPAKLNIVDNPAQQWLEAKQADCRARRRCGLPVFGEIK